jgi:hypothetical protein
MAGAQRQCFQGKKFVFKRKRCSISKMKYLVLRVTGSAAVGLGGRCPCHSLGSDLHPALECMKPQHSENLGTFHSTSQ